jgi:uncharacterized damage-inducible protein DinB
MERHIGDYFFIHASLQERTEMDILERLLGHFESANRELFELSLSLRNEELHRNFGIGLGSVHATILHIIGNIEWWTDLMKGAPARASAEDSLGLDDLGRRLTAATLEFANLAMRVQREHSLDSHWPPRPDQPLTYSFGNTIIHVVIHEAHHRSQWMFMLKSLGVKEIPAAQALSWN